MSEGVRVWRPCKGQHVYRTWGKERVTLELGTREPTEVGLRQQVPFPVLGLRSRWAWSWPSY